MNFVMRFRTAIIITAFFLLSGHPAFAGGPPYSQAFIFCGEFEKEESYRDEVNKFLDTIKDDLGQYYEIENFYLSTHSSPMGRVEHFESPFIEGAKSNADFYEGRKGIYEERITMIENKCPEYLSEVKSELSDEIYKWVKKSDNNFRQGSIFIATHKSKASEEYFENLSFPYDDSYNYKHKEIKKVGDWIIAYSTTSPPNQNTNILLGILGVLGTGLGLVYFRKKHNK